MFKFWRRRVVRRVEQPVLTLGCLREVTNAYGLEKTTCNVAFATATVLGAQNSVKDDLVKERARCVSFIEAMGERIAECDYQINRLVESKSEARYQIDSLGADLVKLTKIEEMIG